MFSNTMRAVSGIQHQHVGNRNTARVRGLLFLLITGGCEVILGTVQGIKAVVILTLIILK